MYEHATAVVVCLQVWLPTQQDLRVIAPVALLMTAVFHISFRAEIVPEAQVEAVVEMYTTEAEERLLGGSPDFVLDAIDNIDTKVRMRSLVLQSARCHQQQQGRG